MSSSKDATDHVKNSEAARKPNTQQGATSELSGGMGWADPRLMTQAAAAPRLAHPETILALQRTIGNQAVQRMIHAAGRLGSTSAPSTPTLNTSFVQRLAQPETEEERVGEAGLAEADDLAEAGDLVDPAVEEGGPTVMLQRTGAPNLQRALDDEVLGDEVEEEQEEHLPDAGASLGEAEEELTQDSSEDETPLAEIEEEGAADQDEATSVQLKRDSAAGLAGGPIQPKLAQEIQLARGAGGTLDSGTRAQMEPLLGANFSGVRIHTDTRSDTINRSLNAKAFTTGSDIFFRQGAYNPHSTRGRELLAHELTHVVQQSGTGGKGNTIQTKLTVGPANDRYEQEADRVAKLVTTTPAPAKSNRNGAAVQRRHAQPGAVVQRSLFGRFKQWLGRDRNAAQTVEDTVDPTGLYSGPDRTSIPGQIGQGIANIPGVNTAIGGAQGLVSGGLLGAKAGLTPMTKMWQAIGNMDHSTRSGMALKGLAGFGGALASPFLAIPGLLGMGIGATAGAIGGATEGTMLGTTRAAQAITPQAVQDWAAVDRPAGETMEEMADPTGLYSGPDRTSIPGKIGQGIANVPGISTVLGAGQGLYGGAVMGASKAYQGITANGRTGTGWKMLGALGGLGGMIGGGLYGGITGAVGGTLGGIERGARALTPQAVQDWSAQARTPTETLGAMIDPTGLYSGEKRRGWAKKGQALANLPGVSTVLGGVQGLYGGGVLGARAAYEGITANGRTGLGWRMLGTLGGIGGAIGGGIVGGIGGAAKATGKTLWNMLKGTGQGLWKGLKAGGRIAKDTFTGMAKATKKVWDGSTALGGRGYDAATDWGRNEWQAEQAAAGNWQEGNRLNYVGRHIWGGLKRVGGVLGGLGAGALGGLGGILGGAATGILGTTRALAATTVGGLGATVVGGVGGLMGGMVGAKSSGTQQARDFTDIMGRPGGYVGFNAPDQGVDWSTQRPNPDATPGDTITAGKWGSPGAVGSLALSVLGLGGASSKWAKAAKDREDMKALGVGGEARAQAALKEKRKAERDTIGNTIATASALSDVIGTVGSAAGNTSASIVAAGGTAFPILGAATGGVEFLRQGYGGIRAAHKARKMAQIKDQVAALPRQDLQEIAGYLHKRKTNTAVTKFFQSAGAGTAAVGSALTLAALATSATPVGWALIGAGVGVGLCVAGYKIIRWLHKRRKRLEKIAAERDQLDPRAAAAGGARGGWWVAKNLFFGGRIKNKQDKNLKSRLINAGGVASVNGGAALGLAGWNAMNNTQKTQALKDAREHMKGQELGAAAAAVGAGVVGGAHVRGVYTTEKERKAHQLATLMQQGDTHAIHMARTLGVVDLIDDTLVNKYTLANAELNRGRKWWGGKRTNLNLTNTLANDFAGVVALIARKL